MGCPALSDSEGCIIVYEIHVYSFQIFFGTKPVNYPSEIDIEYGNFIKVLTLFVLKVL